MGLGRWGRVAWAAFKGKVSGDVFPGTGFCAGESRFESFTDSGPFSIGTILLNPESDWEQYTAADFERVYAINPIVYACCQLISTSLAEAPLMLGWYDAKRKWHPVPQDRSLNILRRPNEWYSYEDFITIWMIRKLLTGAAFVLKFRNGADEVTELWPIPTSWVTFCEAKAGIEGYWLHKDLPTELWIPARDMFFDRFPDPASIFGYVGPAQACSHDIQLDFKRENYMLKMIDNITRPGMVFEQNAPDNVRRAGLTTEQKDELRTDIKRLGHGEAQIYPPGLTVKFPGMVPDLDWSSTEGLIASRICMAFGVEPILIGARVGLKGGTYSNYEHARHAFYEETLKPQWSAVSSVCTRSMLRHEERNQPRWEFKFDLRDVVELYEADNKRMDRGQRALTSGAITVNEYRTEFANMESISDGDVYLRAQNVITEPVKANADEWEAEPEVTETVVIGDTEGPEDE